MEWSARFRQFRPLFETTIPPGRTGRGGEFETLQKKANEKIDEANKNIKHLKQDRDSFAKRCEDLQEEFGRNKENEFS